MVNVIDLLLLKNFNVIIAADNDPLNFLKQRFPDCIFIKFPGFTAKYPKGNFMALKMALQFPEMKRQAKIAKKRLQQIIDEEKIDIVISDNRYELSSNKVYSIFITHQLNIQTVGFQKLFSPFIKWQLNAYFKKFDELWIPDFATKPCLSGDLSHDVKNIAAKAYYVGPLSRFAIMELEPHKKQNDVLVILSGPEPQKSIFERKLELQLSKTDLKVVFLLGKPGRFQKESKGNILKISHLQDKEFAKLILSSDLIICRPGYSAIMDLAVFGKIAFFVPTPGQTEQEYLAKTLMEQGLFFFQKQNALDVNTAIIESKKFRGISLKNDFTVLNSRINKLMKIPQPL